MQRSQHLYADPIRRSNKKAEELDPRIPQLHALQLSRKSQRVHPQCKNGQPRTTATTCVAAEQLSVASSLSAQHSAHRVKKPNPKQPLHGQLDSGVRQATACNIRTTTCHELCAHLRAGRL